VLLLSTLAYVGQREQGSAASAFDAARSALGLADVTILPRESCTLDGLGRALDDLDEASPEVKRRVLEAAVACIAADHEVTAAEAELLRAVSTSISCPMPPILLD
jgi:hypothetical protein